MFLGQYINSFVLPKISGRGGYSPPPPLIRHWKHQQLILWNYYIKNDELALVTDDNTTYMHYTYVATYVYMKYVLIYIRYH